MSAGTPVFQEMKDELHSFIRTYLKDEMGELYKRYPKEQTSIVIDWRKLYQWNTQFAEDLLDSTETIRHAIKLAVKSVDLVGTVDLENDVSVRFSHVDEPYGVNELTGDEVGDLLSVTGQVAKTSSIMPRVTTAALVCKSQGHVTHVPQPRIGVQKPYQCTADECGSKDFSVNFKQSEYEPHQLIRVKQPPEDAEGEEYIDVHLWGDAVGTANAGDRVTVSGTLETDFDDFDSAIPEFWIDGEHVAKHESDYEDLDVSEKKEEFTAIASGVRGDPYQLLIDSIAPTIQGDEKLDTIKLAIGLQLFGGWRRPYGDGRAVRGDFHVGIIGAPGTGKSSLLEAAQTISPRSGYVSGKNATQAGLTAAAVRDDFGDTEWSLEAGAIVKAHKGLCCIDEIDKVDGAALSSLHTALEKQRLEFNKAGIDASLPCHTSVLAAGNPESGHFIDEMDIVNQLNIGPTLRSRFDLLFTLRDDAGEDKDRELASHMARVRQASALSELGEATSEQENIVDPKVDVPTLRAWVAYARENIFPVARDDGLIEEIGQWFSDQRNGEDGAGRDMNRRMVDAVYRLAEASARVRLSDEIVREDVDRAKDIIEQSLDDLGLKDGAFSEFETGVGDEERTMKQGVTGIIKTLQPGDGKGAEIENVVETAVQSGLEEGQVRYEIKRLIDSSIATRPDMDKHIRIL